MSPYIQTQAGAIDLLCPDPADLVLPDLARALAHLNRYTGHVGRYSVAEHCVLGVRVLRERGASVGDMRGFLAHDLHEAITGDISAPMKRAMRQLHVGPGRDPFAEIEHRAAEAVRERFAIGTHGPAVRAMDLAMCVTEARHGFGTLIGDGWPTCAPAETLIYRWDPEYAFAEYMHEAARLGVA